MDRTYLILPIILINTGSNVLTQEGLLTNDKVFEKFSDVVEKKGRGFIRMNNILAIIMMAVLFGCASQTKKIVEAKPDRPEIIIKTSNMDAVKSLLVSKIGKGEWNYLLINKTKDRLTFSREVTAGDEAEKAQLMVGTSFGTIPERIIKFDIMRAQDTVKAIAHPSLSSQNGFGQTNQVNLENDIAIFNALQELLISIKIQIENDLTLNLLPR